MCGLTSTTLTASTPTVGTGIWTITGGAGGIVVNPTSPTSTFTGTAGTAYVLRWTVSNSPCADSFDDVNVTFHQNPTTADAGPDQTGAATCGLTTVTLAGNNPVVGVGAWSIIAGTGGSFADASLSNTTFTGTAGNSYTLRWTITNPPCLQSFDDVLITFNQSPTTANAGSDQAGATTCGMTTVTLDGNNPAIGTGAWTIFSGTGGSFANASLYNTTFTGIAGNTYILRWTITNAPCAPSFDDVIITFNQNPTTSIAGPDQVGAATCGLTTVTLSGNSPAIGTGAWSIQSGTGGSIADATLFNTTFTGSAGTTYVLRWTISNPPCTSTFDDVTVSLSQSPTTANAGPDQIDLSTCGITTVTLAANTPVVGSGVWSIISGTGGTVTTPTSPTSTFTGTAGTAYTLRWTITNAPCVASTDDVNITFNQNPTTADAGPDQTGAATCGNTTVTLAGNVPVAGTGLWSVISGAGGTITTPTSPTSTFTGTAGTTYTLRWTITNAPCGSSADDMVITFNQNPTTADAGPDQTGISTCGLTTVTLAGNAPVAGTGLWSIISGAGGTITTPTSPISTFTGTAGTTYTLRWTITNAPCGISTDDVNITFNQSPTVSDAGTDQTDLSTCGLTTVTLSANSPTTGIGTWSIIGGTGGTITNPSSPTSTFTGTAGTTYSLRWTISNAPCGISTDDVNITFNQDPTIADAGPDQTGLGMCGITITTLTANTPVIGTGSWSIISGTGGNVTAANSPTSTFTGLAGNSYVLRWTIVNPPCAPSTDDVTITFNLIPAPTFTVQPGSAACAGADVTYTTQAGQSNYTWTFSGVNGTDYNITSGGTLTDNSVTLKWLTSGSKTVNINYSNASGCTAAIATSSIPTTVNSLLPVSVTIAADANPVCAGTTVNFTATPTNGGATPVYQWKVNGVNAGVDAANYSYIPLTGDIVTVDLTSDAVCPTGNPATSAPVTMTVNPLLPVSVAIAADANPVCAGTTVNFTATPTNGGATPVYQWKVNGVNAGVDAATYSYIPLTGDIVTVDLTSDAVCPTGNPATSAPVTMTVNPLLPVSVTIAADANPVCAGTTVNFTATPTNGGATPVYQWKVNGVNAGVDAATYSYIPLTGNIVTVDLTSDAVCPTGNPATSAPVTMTVNPLLPVSVTIAADANPVCAGTTVNFTATPTNGGATPVYQWKVNGVNAGVDAATYSYIPLTGDIVTVDLTSDAVCPTGNPATSAPVTMTVNPLLPVSVTIAADANPVCAGTTVNFTATPTNGGATPVYQWKVNGVNAGVDAATYSYIPLTGDIVTVDLTSDAVCPTGNPATSAPVTMTVNPLLPVSVAIAADANPVCAGTTVNFTATPTNGGATPVYQWKVNGVNAGVDAATYSYIPLTGDIVTVDLTSDAVCPTGNPATSAPVTMTVNPLLPVSVTIAADANPVCAGTTVNFTATPTNGGATPVYQWKVNGVNAGVDAATYSYIPLTGDIVTVDLTSDAICQTGGPATSNAVTININSNPTVTITKVDAACFGGSSGSATANASGGTGVYTYSWNTIPVQTSVMATGLAAGTYDVTVSDENSCSATASTTILQPASALSGGITSQTNVSVPGGNDGSVTVDGSGGTSPYQYKIGAGTYQASGTFGGLAAGSYTITVEDINLCQFDIAVTITQPAATVSGSISSQINVACFGSATGSVTVAGSGGVPPYDYSLDGGAYQSSGTFGTLSAGTYTVTVRDSFLNPFNVSVTITQPASALSGSITSQTNIKCFGSNTGSLSVQGLGGTSPYLYKIGSGSFQVSGTFSSLTANSYTITIQDANLCTFEVSVVLTQPLEALTGTIVSQTNVSCSGSTNGAVTVMASGGISPYMYSLNGGPYQVSGTFTNLSGTNYTVTVQDDNLCTKNVTVVILDPEMLGISSTVENESCPDASDGSVSLTISGGTGPYTVLWSDGTATQDRHDISAGEYTVVVVDKNWCQASLVVTVGVVGSGQCIEIPDIITPNNDGYNDTWQIKNIDLFPNAEVFVFTRWGKLVFNTKNIAANPWNGTFKGKLLPTDSYHYVLHLNDGSKPRSGVISIIR